MPTREAITNTIIPQKEAAPIPVRIAVTRPAKPKPQENQTQTQAAPQNGNQAVTGGNNEPAASGAPAESVQLSPELSAAARKEQAFRQRELALKKREEDFATRFAKADKASQFDQLKAKLEAKDYSEAEKLGLNYEDYVKYKLNQANGEDPNAVALKEIRAEIAQMKKEREESTNQEFEATKTEYRREIKAAVENSADFASIKELKAEEHVLQFIVDTFEEDGEHLTVAEACQIVEKHLVGMAKTMSGLSKIKTAGTQTEEQERKLPPPKTGVRTLTNNMQPSSTTPSAAPLHKMSEAERYAEARRRVLARRQQTS